LGSARSYKRFSKKNDCPPHLRTMPATTPDVTIAVMDSNDGPVHPANTPKGYVMYAGVLYPV
jgi:hypothetical protein